MKFVDGMLEPSFPLETRENCLRELGMARPDAAKHLAAVRSPLKALFDDTNSPVD